MFLTDFALRITIASSCFVVFAAGIAGHGHFKKQEAMPGFRPSRVVRRILGYSFGLSALGALVLAIFAVASLDFGYAIILVAYAVGIFPFVLGMLHEDGIRG